MAYLCAGLRAAIIALMDEEGGMQPVALASIQPWDRRLA